MVTHAHYSYDDLDALLSATAKPCTNDANTYIIDDRWCSVGWICADRRDVRTMAHAIEALREPLSPQGVARIEEARKALELPAPASIKRKIVRGDHGDELSMPHVWNGRLDTAWSRAQRQRTFAASRVLVGVFVTGNRNVESSVLAWRGVAAIALSDALEQAGYSVCLRALSRADAHAKAGWDYEERCDVDVTLKAEGMPLDLHKVASLTASSLLLRGILIPHILKHATHALVKSVGSTSESRVEMVDAKSYDHACVVASEVCDQRTAQKWINTQIARLDIRNSDAHVIN